MTAHDSDISWQVLRGVVQQWAGNDAELTEVSPLAGGHVAQTLALRTKAGDRAVIKVSPHRVDRHYEEEVHQLDLMRSLGIPVPRTYHHALGTLEQPHSYLLMEFVQGVDLAEARRQMTPEAFDDLQVELAELLLRLHAHTSDHYCRVLPRDCPGHESWGAFFRTVYDPIWHEAQKTANLPVKVKKQIGKIHEKLDRYLAHDDRPRLLHFDLWSSNILVRPDADGRWHVSAILDPNCKYAHFEAELAYLDLFKTTTPAFKKAYQQVRPLTDGYHRVRKHIYQLYPLIEHVNCFGGEYNKPLLATMDQLNHVI